MYYRVSALLAFALVLAACAAPAPGAGLLSPSDMPGGVQGPSVVGTTGTTATIEFTTGVPTFCNVAYGVDTKYGALERMPMMEGAVREHAVTLRGLTPETTYHYRLTMTDQQARVYQSEDYTFRTGEAEAVSGAEDANLASLDAGARVVGVSSNWAGQDNDGSFGAHKALDSQPSTAWSSDGDGDDAWIEVELDGAYDLHTIGFWTRTMSNDTAQIYRFSVTTDAGETLGPFELPDASQMYTFPINLRARTLRFDAVDTNTGNTGAVEIAVYGSLASS